MVRNLGYSSLMSFALACLVASYEAAEAVGISSNSTSACSFPTSPHYTSHFSFVDIASALKCLNSIEINYDLAWGHAISLSNIFQEFYVFSRIAIDPKNSTESNPYGIKIWDGKVNLVQGLRDLADSWPEDQPIGLAEVALPINTLFNKLFDAHVSYPGSGGRIFGDALNDCWLVLHDVENDGMVFQVSVKAQGKAGVAAEITLSDFDMVNMTTKFAKSINGKPVMEWVVSTIAQSPIFSIPYKSIGARVNQFLGVPMGWNLMAVGDLTPLVGKQYKVQYEDGSTGLWTWAVQFPVGGWSAEQVKNLTEDANTPGIPFSALVKGLDVLVNVTVPDDWQTSRRRAMREESSRLPRLLQPAHDPSSSQLAARRMAQQTMNVSYIFQGTSKVGQYYIASTGRAGYAVWKLTSFDWHNWDQYEAAWRDFVSKAQAAGVKRLIFDVVGNGGGTVPMGYGAALSLFPTMDHPEELLNKYERISGPASRYWIDKAVPAVTSIGELLGNTTWVEARAQELAANITEFKILMNLTAGMNMAISTMLNATSADLGFCYGAPRENCTIEWVSALVGVSDVLQNLQPLLLNGTAPSDDQLLELFAALFAGVKLMDPFFAFEDVPFGYKDPVYHLRGGVNSTYTRPFPMASFPFNTSTHRLPAHPFNKIIALSDGGCGSTCDTFSRTAWFHSLSNPKAPTFRYVTFGGTGKRGDISGTSFPGGNVNDQDFVTQSWGVYGLSYTMARWSGVQEYIDAIDAYGDLLPVPPTANDNATPRFSQSQIYQNAMGPNSLPMEYYHIPSDYHIREWYSGAASLDSPDLPELYTQAAKYFAWMPMPQKTT